MRHEYVEVPESQRLACLKFILKKEILNWNNGNDSSEENENENNSGNSNNENKNEDVNEDIGIKKDSVIVTKNVPIRSRKLLSRKEKIEPISEVIVEEKNEIIDSLITTSTSSSTPVSTSTSTSYPSHYSPFPSAAATYTSSSSSFRPFQAVIFADDEDLALSVCETVKSVLPKNGKRETSFYQCHTILLFM